MKLLCREDHNGGASRSDVGDRRSKLESDSFRTVGSPIPRQAEPGARLQVAERQGLAQVDGIAPGVVVVLEDLSGHVVRPVAGAVRRDSVGILPVMAVVINA